MSWKQGETRYLICIMMYMYHDDEDDEDLLAFVFLGSTCQEEEETEAKVWTEESWGKIKRAGGCPESQAESREGI